jgi:ParB family chromosome partitioning protein
MPGKEAVEAIVNVPLDRIIMDPTQPRKVFSEKYIKELAEDIRANGLLNPIRCYQSEPFLYVIETGECRYRAFQYLKEATIPVIVVEKGSKRQLSNRRLSENLHRMNLSDAELAQEFKKRVDEGETHEEIAKAIGRSRAFVTQRLIILEHPEIFRNVESGKISFGEARDQVFKKPESKEECYDVTKLAEVLPTLEVPKLFEEGELPDDKDKLYDCYIRDMAKLRRIL